MIKAVVKFIDNRQSVEDGIGKFIDRATKKSARVMARNIMETSRNVFHWRTGHLGRSILAYDVSFGKSEVRANPMREDGSLDVNYALYLEYGTKYIAPRAFMRKGVAQSEEAIKIIFKDEARNVRAKVINK